MKLPNGYGSVYKLSGNRRNPYAARITIGWEECDGKRIQKKKVLGYYPTKEAALNALAEFNRNPYNPESNCITFEKVYEKWAAQKLPKISQSCINGYRAAYKLCGSLYKMPFREIKTEHLQKVVDDSGKAHPTLRKLRVLFSQLYKYAMANDIVFKNYSEYVDIGEGGNDSKRVPFTAEEIDRLWLCVNEMPYVDTILIMIYTGWRVGELLQLKIEDIDTKEWVMKGGIKTEAGKNRLVPVHERIRPLVKRLADKKGTYLIKTPEGGEPLKYHCYLDRIFADICIELDMDHRPYDCRHTFATLMDNAGANKLCIKRIMGHASADITDKVYTHKDLSELRKAIDLLK